MADDIRGLVGRRTAELRRRAGMTQAQLAERLGVAVETISRLERGATLPGVETLVRLAQVTGHEPHEVLLPSTKSNPRSQKQGLREEILFSLRKLTAEDLQLARDLIAVITTRRGTALSPVRRRVKK